MSKEAYIASKILAHLPMPPAPRHIVLPEPIDMVMAELDIIENRLRGITLRRKQVEQVHVRLEHLKSLVHECATDRHPFDPDPQIGPYVIDMNGRKRPFSNLKAWEDL